MHSESLADVKVFLRDILVQEKLSCTAEKERLRLLRYLDSRESSPAPYLDMSPNGKNSKADRDKNRTIECYEEFSSAKDTNSADSNSDKIKESSKPSSARSSSSSGIYYNITQAFRSSSSWDINDDRPSVPQKDSRNSLCISATPSTRNSMCSLTTGITKKNDSDTTDTVSEASSSASNNCSSKNTSNSSPEVLTVSASALRYSAAKCGLLCRKERFLFLEHYKQYWVGLLGRTLYIYTSDKDSKPVLELDIEGYQARPVGLRDSPKKENSFEIFCPGNKTYQFTAPGAPEMDQWITAICQAGKVPENVYVCAPAMKAEQTAHRQLPSIPAELLYDQPDSIIRPVTPRQSEQYETMNSNCDDDFYHYISNDKCQPIKENPLYKNLEEMSYAAKENGMNLANCDENVYYNLVPGEDGDLESIYDIIREGDHGEKIVSVPVLAPAPVPVSSVPFPVPASGRIQQIIQKIEAQAASTNSSKQSCLIQDELYEPVNTPEETSVSPTISR